MQTDDVGETILFGQVTDGVALLRATFTPTGADLILRVFDASGARARTWRDSAVRRD